MSCWGLAVVRGVCPSSTETLALAGGQRVKVFLLFLNTGPTTSRAAPGCGPWKQPHLPL